MLHGSFQPCRGPSHAVEDCLKNVFQPFDEIQYFSDQLIYILACEKARIAHETSQKSSVSEFSDGLISFQVFMIHTCKRSI